MPIAKDFCIIFFVRHKAAFEDKRGGYSPIQKSSFEVPPLRTPFCSLERAEPNGKTFSKKLCVSFSFDARVAIKRKAAVPLRISNIV